MPPVLRNDLIALLTIGSLAMLGASYASRDNWLGDLLLQIGSALLLLVPFLLLTRWLEQQFSSKNEKTREAVSTTQRAVENLEDELNKVQMARTSSEIDELVASRLNDEHKMDRELFEGLAKAPSRADVIQALHRAAELHIIASFGIRVEIGGGTGVYMWFRPQIDGSPDQDPLLVTVQEWNLTYIADIYWDPGNSIVDFLVDVASQLKQTSHWAGDSRFRAGKALLSLSEALVHGHRAVVEGDEDIAREIFELVDNSWVVGESSLSHFSTSIRYVIQYSRLNELNWQRQMLGKEWVEQAAFQKALDTAICLVADNIAEGELPEYLPGVWKHR